MPLAFRLRHAAIEHVSDLFYLQTDLDVYRLPMSVQNALQITSESFYFQRQVVAVLRRWSWLIALTGKPRQGTSHRTDDQYGQLGQWR